MEHRADERQDTAAPGPWIQIAGLVALVALASLDALAPGWDPDPWVYAAGVLAVVWGPGLLSRRDGG